MHSFVFPFVLYIKYPVSVQISNKLFYIWFVQIGIQIRSTFAIALVDMPLSLL